MKFDKTIFWSITNDQDMIIYNNISVQKILFLTTKLAGIVNCTEYFSSEISEQQRSSCKKI